MLRGLQDYESAYRVCWNRWDSNVKVKQFQLELKVISRTATEVIYRALIIN